jgi:hypothetical protein
LIFEGVIMEFPGRFGKVRDSVGYVLGKRIFVGNWEVNEAREDLLVMMET